LKGKKKNKKKKKEDLKTETDFWREITVISEQELMEIIIM